MTIQKPSKLAEILSRYTKAEEIVGRLGDKIVRYEDDKQSFVYLKSGTGISAEFLRVEVEVLKWLEGKGITTPKVLDFECENDKVFLLMSGIKGLPSYKHKIYNKHKILKIVAKALKIFHQVDLSGSEHLNSLDKDLQKIEKYLKLDVIILDNFKKANSNKTPKEVFDFLLSTKDKFEDNVLTHGDFCLPNILLDGENFGIIDLGGCGPGDKYKDLSSMEVSIKRNFGVEWVDVFNQNYDPKLKIDRDKIKYFQLIDQFDYHLDVDKFYKLTKTNKR